MGKRQNSLLIDRTNSNDAKNVTDCENLENHTPRQTRYFKKIIILKFSVHGVTCLYF